MKNHRNWWWRKFRSLPKDSPVYLAWREIDEVAAFRYELARRAFPPLAYPPYTALGRHELDIVRAALSHGRPPVAIFHQNPPPSYHEGYVPLPSMSWNLRAGDNSLVRVFLDCINQNRKAKKMKAVSANKANYHRGPSWRWLELLDSPNRLSNADRSHLALARRR